MQIENFLETAMKRTCCRMNGIKNDKIICDYTEMKQWWNECFRDLYVNVNNMPKSAIEINSKTEEIPSRK